MLRRDRLLQRCVDRGELGVQGAAQRIDDGNNRERDAGGYQAVFNSGGARLILNETRTRFFIFGSMCPRGCRTQIGLTGVLSTVTIGQP